MAANAINGAQAQKRCDGCQIAAAIVLGWSCWTASSGSAGIVTCQEPVGAQLELRASIERVLVDMRVTRDGQPVVDLQPDELALFVDGIPRAITSLTYAPLAVPPNESERPVRGPTPTSPPSGSAHPTRRLVFVIDRKSMEFADARQLLKRTERFLLALPADVAVAIATLPIPSGFRFTPDRNETVRALRAAFKGVTRRGAGLEGIAGFGCSGEAASAGCGDQGIESITGFAKARERNRAAEWLVRGRQTLADLQWLFRSLDDAPSDVVIISGGLPYHPSLRTEVDRTLVAAQASGTRVHAVEVANLTSVALPEGGTPTALTLATLEERHPVAYRLPEETGGVHREGVVSGDDFFAQLSRDLSSLYVLSFEPSASDRDGRPHRIDLRIARRPQLTIHARRAFTVAPLPRAPIPPALDSATTASSDAAADGAMPLATVLQRASDYVDAFQRTFSTMVLLERYVQLIRPWSSDRPMPLRDPELSWRESQPGSPRPETAIRRRQLLSDLLLVQPTGQTWIGYRDVAEVDGKPVRDRTVRVEKLFLSDAENGRRQLQRIATESARYNLGPSRNINLPTFPLQLLRPDNLARFEWTVEARDRSREDPANCTSIAFREIGDETIVRTDRGFNVPMTGLFCIEPASGRVWRATVRFRQPLANVDSAFEVRFGATDESDVLVPESAWESSLGNEASVSPLMSEGLAIYSNARRFGVTIKEQFK